MTNTPHDLEPGFHSQVNKAIAIFGQPAVPSNIGIYAFTYYNPSAGTSNSTAVVAEAASNDGSTFGTGRLSAKSIIWTMAQGTATIPAGAIVSGRNS